jgi:hypothetical protein
MFSRSKAVTFEPYGRRRSRWRLPGWLWLLLGGLAAGAGGVLYAQERYLPQRLTVEASARLSSAFEQADAERLRLAGELGRASKSLETALAEKNGLVRELAASRATGQRLQDDLASVVAALPPDPRSGVVELRAGRFTASGGALAYDLVLTRAQAGGKPMAAVMQLVVTGESTRRTASSVALAPVTLALGRHEVLRGSLPLPEGFQPRQASVQILDQAAGRQLGMRMWVVRPAGAGGA